MGNGAQGQWERVLAQTRWLLLIPPFNPERNDGDQREPPRAAQKEAPGEGAQRLEQEKGSKVGYSARGENRCP